jgi:hypothetical protein
MKKLVSRGLSIILLTTGCASAHIPLIHQPKTEKSRVAPQQHPRNQTRPKKIKLRPIDKAWSAKVARLLGVPSSIAHSPQLDLANEAITHSIDFEKIQFASLTSMLKNASLTLATPTIQSRNHSSSEGFRVNISFGNDVMPTSVFEDMIKVIMCASVINADQVFFQGNKSNAVSRNELGVPLEEINTHYSPAFEEFATTLMDKLSSPFITKTVISTVRVLNAFAPSNSRVTKMVSGINSINTAMLTCSVVFNKHKRLSDKIFNFVLNNNNNIIAQDLTPLEYMVIENQPARVLELLNKGFDANVTIKQGTGTESLLSRAIRSGSHAAAKVLIEHPGTNLLAPAQTGKRTLTCLELLNETIAHIKKAAAPTVAKKSLTEASTELEQYENLRTLYLQKLSTAKR